MTPIRDSLIDFTRGAPASGSLDVRWIHGSPSKRRGTDPKIQVYRYDVHTFILRQSKTVSFEAPFLFLQRRKEALLTSLASPAATIVRNVIPRNPAVPRPDSPGHVQILER